MKVQKILWNDEMREDVGTWQPCQMKKYCFDSPLSSATMVAILQSFDESYDVTNIEITLQSDAVGIESDCVYIKKIADYNERMSAEEAVEEISFDVSVDNVAGYKFVLHTDGELSLLYNSAIPWPYNFDPYIQKLERIYVKKQE